MTLFSLGKKKAASTPAARREPETARRDDDPMVIAVTELRARLKAIAAGSQVGQPAGKHGAELSQMRASMEKISAGLRSLAVQAAHGAAHLDTTGLGAILDRMDSLGDATMHRIMGRIAVTVSREDRKHLQVLRDELRAWLDARDAHLQEAQLALDTLSETSRALREALLEKAGHLMNAAELSQNHP